MSYDPQSPTDAADMDEYDAICEDCGDELDSNDINVEAFELSGQILCKLCAEAYFEREADPDRLREDRDERRKP